MLFWTAFLSLPPPSLPPRRLVECGAYQHLIKNNFTLKVLMQTYR